MTATVTKGTNRPAAKARANRHAQRTPLPPKASVSPENAKKILDKVGATRAADQATEYGRMSVAELTARAKALKVSPLPRTKGALLTAILQAETAEAKVDQALNSATETEAKIDAAFEVDEKAPATTTAEEVITEAAQALSGESKGQTKARALDAITAPHGWTMEVRTPADGRVEAILTRGHEAFHVEWINGVFTYESATYAIGDRVTKIRNISQARQMAARTPEQAEAEAAKVAANKVFRPREKAVERKVRLPFDPETASDEVIIAALLGKTVIWKNRISQEAERATINRDPRKLHLETFAGERVARVLCSNSGFRAFRLSALISVGRNAKSDA